MTRALFDALWPLGARALLAALWVVEHAVLARRALRAGEPAWLALTLPVVWARRAGHGAAALRWSLFALAYAVLVTLR